MNQSFYIGAVGAQQQMLRLNVHGNNIANVNTTGYKAEKGRFEALLYDEFAAAEQTLLSGVGTRLSNTDTDFSAGYAADTGRRLDYMIEGRGFFAVVDLNTGETSLTRNGAFMKASLQRDTGEVDEEGQPIMETVYYLSDGEGRFVMGETGSMIEMTDDSSDAEPPAIGVFDYINYNGMQHIEETRFLAVDKNGGIRFGSGKVINRMLESSNVDLAEEMTKVIESQRAYTAALKMVTTSDEIETTINNLRN